MFLGWLVASGVSWAWGPAAALEAWKFVWSLAIGHVGLELDPCFVGSGVRQLERARPCLLRPPGGEQFIQQDSRFLGLDR